MASTDYRYRSSEEIQREAERTRADIAGTLDAIQERLSSAYWQSRYLDGMAVLEIVRRHPLPSLVLAVGALWLAAEIVRDPAFQRRSGLRPLPRGRAPVRPEELPPPTSRVRAMSARPEQAAVAPSRERAADDLAAAQAMPARTAAARS